MSSLLCLGNWSQKFDLLATLHAAGFSLVMPVTMQDAEYPQHTSLVLIAFDSSAAIQTLLSPLSGLACPWIGLNNGDDTEATLVAYSSGVSAVLPRATTGPILLRTVRQAMAAPSGPGHARGEQPPGMQFQQLRRGQVIRRERETVFDVCSGIVASMAIHQDGASVLLGLSGPGQLLVSHPLDSCSIQLAAHTDTVLRSRAWSDAAADTTFPDRLRARILQIEAWAAMQARPHLDARLMGLLSLLTEQFGVRSPAGTIVDVRLTHAQLAAATGATRTTITRVLRNLRAQGRLSTLGSGEDERICLPHSEFIDHGLY